MACAQSRLYRTSCLHHVVWVHAVFLLAHPVKRCNMTAHLHNELIRRCTLCGASAISSPSLIASPAIRCVCVLTAAAIMGLSPSHLLPLAAVGLSVAASVTSAVLLYWCVCGGGGGVFICDFVPSLRARFHQTLSLHLCTPLPEQSCARVLAEPLFRKQQV